MDINNIIMREAAGDNEHDRAYAKALKDAYVVYCGLDIVQLKHWQVIARKNYDSSQEKTAACIILYELIKEKVR